MNNGQVTEAKGRGKKPANQTQSHMPKLSAIEAETCVAYLQALGFRNNLSGWANPPEMDLPPGFEIKIESGLVSANVEGDRLSGYKLIARLISRSKIQGLHPVKIGALVMVGIHDLNLFTELKGFEKVPHNLYRKMMHITEQAMAYFHGDLVESNIKVNGEGLVAENQVVIAASKNPSVINDANGVESLEVAEPEINSIGNGNATLLDDVQSAANMETDHAAADDLADGINLHSARLEEGPDIGTEPIEPKDVETGAAKKQETAHLAAILKAFNDRLPPEAECLKELYRHNKNQFCVEIQIGKLLIQKKEELKSTRLFGKWREEHLPEAEWSNNFISQCTRLALFERSLKNRRGVLLQERDIDLCPKKVMLLIGGYKKKNVDDFVDAIVARLDCGERLTEGAVSKLVQEFKGKVGKAKQQEIELPPVPDTIEELFNLPDKYLSSFARKNMPEFHELLESLTPIPPGMNEAAVVVPLVRIFTVL